MNGKHYMTFSERLENRDDSLYEKAFDYVWDKSANLLKRGAHLAVEGFSQVVAAVDRYDAREQELRAKGLDKPLFNNLPIDELNDDDDDRRPTYNELAIPGNPEFNSKITGLLQTYDQSPSSRNRIKELAKKIDSEREYYYDDYMSDLK